MTALVRESVGPGIARLIVPTATLPPATTTNAWLLGTDALTVVDPGASDPSVQAAVVEALSGDRIDRIVLTHHHPDHTSGARHLALATGAAILAHPDTASLFGPVSGTLRDGDPLHIGPHTWTTLHTPGHAHGHICLLREADGQVVVGDLLAGEGTILIAPPEGHLATYLHSLRRLQRVGASRALPAHGPPLDAPTILDHYLQHRQLRSDQVLEALQSGPSSPLQLAGIIYPELPEAFLPVAALQLTAHLTWWKEREAVHEQPDGTWITAPG